jgi:hypothetical protein
MHRGLGQLSSKFKVVILKSTNDRVARLMMMEPDPKDVDGDHRIKFIGNPYFKITKVVSDICREYSEMNSINFICYTNKLLEGDINSFLENPSGKTWIILTDETLSQGIEATSVLYIDKAPEIEQQLGTGRGGELPKYKLDISRRQETLPGHALRFSSFKKIDDILTSCDGQVCILDDNFFENVQQASLIWKFHTFFSFLF